MYSSSFAGGCFLGRPYLATVLGLPFSLLCLSTSFFICFSVFLPRWFDESFLVLSSQVLTNVEALRSPNGGFGCNPGDAPDLYSTYACVRVIMNNAGELDRELTYSWVKTHQLEHGGFCANEEKPLFDLDATYQDPAKMVYARTGINRSVHLGLLCCSRISSRQNCPLSKFPASE